MAMVMKQFTKNRNGSLGVMGSVVGILITIIISILIVYNVASSISLDTDTERQINENRGLTVGQDAYTFARVHKDYIVANMF